MNKITLIRLAITLAFAGFNIQAHTVETVTDASTIETGSFNYSESAAKYNSENVLVIWNSPQVAASYLVHWKSRYEQGVDLVINLFN